MSNSACKKIVQEIGVCPKLETGGLLLGYWGEKSKEPVITDIVGPGPKAVHEETHFEPDYDFQEVELNSAYQCSGRKLTYLGDWHTHPKGSGELSDKDIATMARIAEFRKSRTPVPLMLVVVVHPNWTPWLWVGRIKQKYISCPEFVVSRIAVTLFDD